MCRQAIAAAAFAYRALALAAWAACGSHAAGDPGPALQIVGEATVVRSGDAVPATSPYFDGTTLRLTAARGETLGIQVLHRGGGRTVLAIGASDVAIRSFEVRRARVTRPSTALYGGSRGAGDYPDLLVEKAEPQTDPAYFEIAVGASVTPAIVQGELAVAGRRVPVVLTITTAIVPPLPVEGAWAYEDPREFAWAKLPPSTLDDASASERACIALAHRYGVLLSPDLPVSAWPARKDLLAGAPDVPARIATEPAAAAADVRAWIAATTGTHQVPFAIPLDEPRDAAAWAAVRTLSAAVRAAGGGPTSFRYAVTAAPRAELGDAIDLYIAPDAAHLIGDTVARWTYNGRPPAAGAFVVDAAEPGPRTWGWIAWRYQIATWYVWDALYWHDRHNRHGAELPGRAYAEATDAVSFDDGEDHGNLDGVLLEPGDAKTPCRPTLRLAQLRRGLEDRALLDAAFACDPAATQRLAERVIPRALGDATGAAAWPASDADFERARVDLVILADACNNRLPR